MRFLIVICSAFALSGCGVASAVSGWFGGEGLSSRPLPFRASLSRGDDDRRDFVVTVSGAADASLEAVRESARFQATRYCLTTYGGSEAGWVADPVTGDWAFRREEDRMIFQGRCVAR
ncbi:MAG: hypothetical protein GKR98_06130 [Boseongicola sp.]|nr:MAG: hypothetical protein GKR98_06130 [Boseongicola sp.]